MLKKSEFWGILGIVAMFAVLLLCASVLKGVIDQEKFFIGVCISFLLSILSFSICLVLEQIGDVMPESIPIRRWEIKKSPRRMMKDEDEKQRTEAHKAEVRGRTEKYKNRLAEKSLGTKVPHRWTTKQSRRA